MKVEHNTMKIWMLLVVIALTVIMAVGCGINKADNSNIKTNTNETNASLLDDKEQAICNSVLVKSNEKVSITEIENCKKALSKSEALSQIQLYIDSNDMVEQGDIPSSKGIITGLSEIFIDDAFEKMNLQAYAAISDHGFAGCFLIRYGVVSYVWGNLDNSCVVDIDNDGNYELLDLFAWGSGIYRIELSAYEYSNPIYFSSLTEILQRKYYSCFVPDSGYAELKLKKVDDTTVKLVGPDKDYGPIKTEGSKLVVEKMEEFPFEQWAERYDQNITMGREIVMADKLQLKKEDISIINKSVNNNDITMSVVSSRVVENIAVVMLAFTKDGGEVFGNSLNPGIEKLTIGDKTIGNKIIGNKTIENSMLVSELSEDKKTLYCYLTWHTEEPLDGKTVTLNVEQLICNESQVIGKTFSDEIINGKWSINFLLKANTNNIRTGTNLELNKTVSMCGKELQIDSVKIADLQVIVNTTTLSDNGKPDNPLSSISTDSGMYYGVFVTVIYDDGSQSEMMDCRLDENDNIIAYSFNTLTGKKINEVHLKDVVVLVE